MTNTDITECLSALFGSNVQRIDTQSWQVETENARILVLLSDDQSWLRVLLPIAPLSDAQPFLEQLLTANFDETQEVRYALHQDVLWGVFQHNRESLTVDDFQGAIARLLLLKSQGLTNSFNTFTEQQIRQIIAAAKRQGQSLETTLQTLERFYAEGIMGSMQQPAADRQAILDAWRYQLERLWDEAD
ncbi:MAG: hypothetical protein IGR76_01595 [Synechococcales cyanobacterium T60_A2020_003]|nr:hypothetical protein [Synechococcales cyanobacterium T60_A2020_003]